MPVTFMAHYVTLCFFLLLSVSFCHFIAVFVTFWQGGLRVYKLKSSQGGPHNITPCQPVNFHFAFCTLSIRQRYGFSTLSVRFLYAVDTPCLILVRECSEASVSRVRDVSEENKMKVRGGGEGKERRRSALIRDFLPF